MSNEKWVKCMWCGQGPDEEPGFFVWEGPDVAYHENCPAIFAAREGFLKEQEFCKAIIDELLVWLDQVNHYGDFQTPPPYDDIITKARKKVYNA